MRVPKTIKPPKLLSSFMCLLLVSTLLPVSPAFASFYLKSQSNVYDVGNAFDGNISSFAAMYKGTVTTLEIGGLSKYSILRIRMSNEASVTDPVPLKAEYFDSNGSIISQNTVYADRYNPDAEISLPSGTESILLTKESSSNRINIFEINLNATAANPALNSATLSGRDVTLIWSHASSSNGYAVYRNNVRVSPPQVYGTSYVDRLPASGTYTYLIRAVDKDGYESGRGNALSVTATIPNAPLNLTATLVGSEVTLSWSASPPTGLLGYNVYRNDTKLNSTVLTQTTLTDLLEEGGSYAYTVTAVLSSGAESDPSSPAVVTLGTPRKPIDLITGRNPINGGNITIVTPKPVVQAPVQSLLPYEYRIAAGG